MCCIENMYLIVMYVQWLIDFLKEEKVIYMFYFCFIHFSDENVHFCVTSCLALIKETLLSFRMWDSIRSVLIEVVPLNLLFFFSFNLNLHN